MELSVEMLRMTIACSGTQTGERRKHARVPLRFKVKLIPYEDRVLGDPVFVWTRDICEGGIGIIHHKPMREGRNFIIRLPRQDDTPVLLLCTVRCCNQVAASVFNIGASFAEVAPAPNQDWKQAVQDHFHPELKMNFTAEKPKPVDLTDELRRISNAILS